MREEGPQNTLPPAKVDELAHLLQAGMFEEFMRLFKLNARDVQGAEGPATLADLVNKQLEQRESDMKLVVSQKTNEKKHLIMIIDSSRFWGDSWTITRQMFTV